jgi:hypothetical protein
MYSEGRVFQSSYDEHEDLDVSLVQSDSDSYETLLCKSRTENSALLSDVNTLLKYDVDLTGKYIEKPFGIPEDLDQPLARKSTQSPVDNDKQKNLNWGLKHNIDIRTRYRFKRQLFQKFNTLNKRRRSYRKSKGKPELGGDSSSEREDEIDDKSGDSYSNVFFGTTAGMLSWNRKKIETDLLEKEQTLIINELDLHSEEVKMLHESDHEIQKLKIRARLKAKLDDNARKIILKAKKIRHDLKTKSGLVKEQVKETWQKKKLQHMGSFFTNVTETANSDNSSKSC